MALAASALAVPLTKDMRIEGLEEIPQSLVTVLTKIAFYFVRAATQIAWSGCSFSLAMLILVASRATWFVYLGGGPSLGDLYIEILAILQRQRMLKVVGLVALLTSGLHIGPYGDRARFVVRLMTIGALGVFRRGHQG